MFVTVFDEAYADWGVLLLRTLQFHHPEIRVVVVSVDTSDRTDERCLSSNANVMLEKRHIADFGPNRPARIVNARPEWYREVMMSFNPCWCLFLDADLILRRNVDSLLDTVKGSDAALVFRNGRRSGRVYRRLRVAAGLVLIKRSGQPLLGRWCEMVRRQSSVEDVAPQAWFWDQVSLFDAAKVSEDIRIGSIPLNENLSSYPFSSNSTFWSANMRPPKKQAMFQKFVEEVSRTQI